MGLVRRVAWRLLTAVVWRRLALQPMASHSTRSTRMAPVAWTGARLAETVGLRAIRALLPALEVWALPPAVRVRTKGRLPGVAAREASLVAMVAPQAATWALPPASRVRTAPASGVRTGGPLAGVVTRQEPPAQAEVPQTVVMASRTGMGALLAQAVALLAVVPRRCRAAQQVGSWGGRRLTRHGLGSQRSSPNAARMARRRPVRAGD
jgi:hypothetical protein